MSIRLERIIPPDGYGGKTITTAAQFGYDRHGLEGYLGNVGRINIWTNRAWV
jgi:hypothetical protein